MKVMDDNFMVCGDCLQAIVNDDHTRLDYRCEVKEGEWRMKAIQDGIKAVKGHIVCNSRIPTMYNEWVCHCCKTETRGFRYQCVVLEQ